MDLGPGRHDSTGWSRRQVSDDGGIMWAVCQIGETPLEVDGRTYWNGRSGKHVCKRK
jgi:hypothetical protein